jgi:iron complex transport system substrate-binding protein
MIHPRCRASAWAIACLLLASCSGERASPRNTGHPEHIVTLSPHLAELVFAIGAGDLLIGVSAYTDFPDAAARLPVVGDAFNLDLERLALLEPDLLLAWDTGTPAHVIDELAARGYRVEIITTTGVADIPEALNRIGELTGRSSSAGDAADAFRSSLADIAGRYSDAQSIRVFYQVDARPLYTINGRHFLSDLIELCGGTNVFSDLDGLAPLISVEAVLERDPEVILASTDAGPSAFEEWDRWQALAANRYGNRFLMPANDIGRPTPRLLNGAEALCQALADGRQNRDGGS